jgi:MFS family permease
MTVNPAPVASQDEPGTKEHKGLVVGTAGTMVTRFLTTFLSPLLAVIGAGITLAFGGKVGQMVLIVPAVITLTVGNLLVGSATSPVAFIVGFIAVNIAFFCISPLLLALAAELDTNSGQLVVLVGAVTLVAGSIAPALSGWIAGTGARTGTRRTTLEAELAQSR